MASFLAQIKERNIAPTNYLHVSKSNTPIQGQYALDLSLPELIETALHVFPVKGDQEPNLYLKTSKGPITAEVWIIPDMGGKSREAVLNFTTQSGSIQAKVVRLTQILSFFNYEEGRVLTCAK